MVSEVEGAGLPYVINVWFYLRHNMDLAQVVAFSWLSFTLHGKAH